MSQTIIKANKDAIVQKIDRDLLIKPPCEQLADELISSEHLLGTHNATGHHMHAAQRGLYETIETEYGPVGHTPAGLEPAVTMVLERQGYRIQRLDRPPVLPEPAPDDLVGHDLSIDTAVIDLVRQHDLGLVRMGPDVRPAWLIAQIGLAYPDLSIVVATPTQEAAKRISHELRTWLPHSITALRSDVIPGDTAKIVVGSNEAILGGCMDLNRRGLLVAVDPIALLSKRGADVIGAADSARLIGLLPTEQQLAPRDGDHLRCTFGFHEVIVPAHGSKPLRENVFFEKLTGGTPISELLEGVELQRRGVWRNDMVNRRIAKIARAHSCKRVAVLVSNVEHAIALAKKLPGCRIEAAEVNTVGMSAADCQLLTAAMNVEGEKAPRVITLAAAEKTDPRKLDVMVRADGGYGLPPFNPDTLSVPYEESHRFDLIDLVDKRHHELGCATRSRRRAYRKNGLYPAGQIPSRNA